MNCEVSRGKHPPYTHTGLPPLPPPRSFRLQDLSDVGVLSLVERAATLRVLRLRLPSPPPVTWCSEVALMQRMSTYPCLPRCGE